MAKKIEEVQIKVGSYNKIFTYLYAFLYLALTAENMRVFA